KSHVSLAPVGLAPRCPDLLAASPSTAWEAGITAAGSTGNTVRLGLTRYRRVRHNGANQVGHTSHRELGPFTTTVCAWGCSSFYLSTSGAAPQGPRTKKAGRAKPYWREC